MDQQGLMFRQIQEDDGERRDRSRDGGSHRGPSLILTVGTPGGGNHDFPIPLEDLNGREMDVRTLIEEACAYGADIGTADAAQRMQLRESIRGWLSRASATASDGRGEFQMLMQRGSERDFTPIQPRTRVRYRQDATMDQRLTISFAESQAGGR